MIFRTLRRDQWETKLRSLGYKPQEGLGKLNTAEFWTDGTSYPITIPSDANGEIDFWAFQRICKAIGDPLWDGCTGDDN